MSARRFPALFLAALGLAPGLPAEPAGYSLGVALEPDVSPFLLEVDLGPSTVRFAGILEIPGPFIAADLAAGPRGEIFTISKDELHPRLPGGRSLWAIDPTVPSSRLVGVASLAAEEVPSGLTFDACGRLWLSTRAARREESRLLELDPRTGEILSKIPLEHRIQGLAARGETLYTWVEVEFSVFALGEIDPLGGRVRVFPDTTVPRGVMSLDFGPTGQLWGVLAIDTVLPFPSLVHRVDESDGRVTFRGKIAPPLFGLALEGFAGACPSVPVVAIPAQNPAGLLVLGVLLAVLGILRQRSRGAPRRGRREPPARRRSIPAAESLPPAGGSEEGGSACL